MMNERTRSCMLGVVVLLVALAVTSSCITEYANKGEGGSCRATADCQPGLVCLDRECTLVEDEVAPPRRDAEFADSELDAGDPGDSAFPDLPPPIDVGEDVIEDVTEDTPDPDTGMVCTPGERSCASNAEIRTCNDRGTGYSTTFCPPDAACEGGTCVQRNDCEDNDGDGFFFGPGCIDFIDCGDFDPQIFPGARERCNGLDDDCDGVIDGRRRNCEVACNSGRQTCVDGRWQPCDAPPPRPEICNNGIDEDCDGVIDNGCQMCCTQTSCGPEQVCDGCECLDAPRDDCLFQNQPCDPFTAGNDGQWFCVDFANGDDGLCLGRCDPLADDPDATCPQSGSICAFEIEFGEALCLDGCDPQTQTGCFPGSSCILIGDEGGCVPAGSIDENDDCDINAGPFGQCDDGLICIEVDQFGGSCLRLCDPFSAVAGEDSVCTGDTGCFPIDEQFGLCIPSLGQPEGASCNRFDFGQPCDDGVVCAGSGAPGQPGCVRTCRLDNGNADCITGGRCRNAPGLGIPGVGTCR